ncbi:hypothetical protein IKE83_00115 [Candidatus Saccharibacteria bacterium]|nr:hypothetical protein [Candidatus Saccharibacteria bacterium]
MKRCDDGKAKVFFREIVAEKTPEEEEYLIQDLFYADDLKGFRNRKTDIFVEMWVDEVNDINVRLVSKANYVDTAGVNMLGEPMVDAVLVQFDTATARFSMPCWMIELTGRYSPKGEKQSEGHYIASFAAGVYSASKLECRKGVTGEVKLLRRIY